MISRTALVVGGSGGIGAAVCRRLAQDWERILIGYRTNERIAREVALDCGNAQVLRIDLTERDSIAAALDMAGQPLDLVMAGGVNIAQPKVGDIRNDQWHEVIEHELLGFTRLIGAALPRLRAQGGGAVVAVTSFANVHFPPGDALSSVPKAGIEALCRAVAKEEGRNGVRVNCVAPGMVDAGLGARYLTEMLDPETWNRVRRRIPLDRFAAASDIAEAVAFFLSEKSSYITGQSLVVDGGQSL